MTNAWKESIISFQYIQYYIDITNHLIIIKSTISKATAGYLAPDFSCTITIVNSECQQCSEYN